MSKVLSVFWVWTLVATFGCKQAEKAQPTSSPSTQLAASTPVPNVASAVPSEPLEPVVYRTALFADKKLLMCMEKTFKPAAVAAAAKKGMLDDVKRLEEESATKLAKENPDVTILKQPCDSLGLQALATCTAEAEHLTTASHYYQDSHSDKYMADCVKKGGTWSRNASPEAELQRAQQKLEKLEQGAP